MTCESPQSKSVRVRGCTRLCWLPKPVPLRSCMAQRDHWPGTHRASSPPSSPESAIAKRQSTRTGKQRPRGAEGVSGRPCWRAQAPPAASRYESCPPSGPPLPAFPARRPRAVPGFGGRARQAKGGVHKMPLTNQDQPHGATHSERSGKVPNAPHLPCWRRGAGSPSRKARLGAQSVPWSLVGYLAVIGRVIGHMTDVTLQPTIPPGKLSCHFRLKGPAL